MPIICDVSDFIENGRTNVISVRCSNFIKEGWWYEGGGLYRHAHLIITDATHFEEDGVFISSKFNGNDNWDINVKAWIEGDLEGFSLKTEIAELGINIESAVEASVATQTIPVKNPKLWDTENPNLYTATCSLLKGGEVVDSKQVTFGIREIKFDANKGCFINGKSLKFKGVCLHHDHAGVGVALPDSVYDYRMGKLREMGCNAVRTSHNPKSPVFYEICDRLGFVVMNETRHFSSAKEELYDLERFVKRDRNHPCVIMWSILNEEPMQGSISGRKIATTMSNLIKELDGTRAISAGCNGPFQTEGITKVVDVMGFNYMQYGYDAFHKLFPNLPIFGSENGSYLSNRGIEKTDPKAAQVARFGNVLYENEYPWSADPGENWKYIEDREFVCGGFYWTGIDYLGESGPFYWPSVSSNFGAMDLCGFPKDNFYWHRALWHTDPVLKVTPHWNYNEGDEVNVICYSNCDEIELSVNGKVTERFKHDKYKAVIHKTKFEAGCLKATGFINGEKVCEDVLYTAEENSAFKFVLSKDTIEAGSFDASVVDIYAVDKNGNIVPECNDELTVSVGDNTVLLGVGNGDTCCHYNQKGNKIAFFKGCAQIIVGAKEKGEVSLTVCSDTVSSTATLKAVEDTKLKICGSENILLFQAFHMSDLYDVHPRYDELNSPFYTWIPTPVGYGKNLVYSGGEGYGTVKGNFTWIPDDMTIYVEGLCGECEVYVNGELQGSSNGDYETVAIPVKNAKLEAQNMLQVVFNVKGKDCGILGRVYAK